MKNQETTTDESFYTVKRIKRLMDEFVRLDRDPEASKKGLDILESTAKVTLPVRSTLRILWFQVKCFFKAKLFIFYGRTKFYLRRKFKQ